MGEKRGGEWGYAKPQSWLQYWGVFQSTRNGQVPDAEKFEGKWFKGEDPEGSDELSLKLTEKRREAQAEFVERTGFKEDNVYLTHNMKMNSHARAPVPEGAPMFSDFAVAPYAVSYCRMKYTYHLQAQLQHCIGSLGADHPTCAKAAWYKQHATPPQVAAWYEETEELGHWDVTRKWGYKPHGSFLPAYQPVKTVIPGAYEFYRSQSYLDAYDPEGEGETSFPFQYVE